MEKDLERRIREAEQGIYEEPQVISRGTNYKKLIKKIVPVALGLVSAIVATIFLVIPALDKAKEIPGLGEAERAMLSVLPYVFGILLVVGAVAYIGYQGREESQQEGNTEGDE